MGKLAVVSPEFRAEKLVQESLHTMKKSRSRSAETERMVLGLCAYAMYCYTNGSAQHAYTLLKECEQLLGGAEPPIQRLVH